MYACTRCYVEPCTHFSLIRARRTITYTCAVDMYMYMVSKDKEGFFNVGRHIYVCLWTVYFMLADMLDCTCTCTCMSMKR